MPVRITINVSTDWKVRSADFDGLVRKGLAELAPGLPLDVFRIDEAPMVGAAVAAVRVVLKRRWRIMTSYRQNLI